MAVLGIENATIGFDTEGTRKALNEIRASVIQEAIQKLNKSKTDFAQTVHEVWKGKSADIYLQNSENLIDEINRRLQETFEEKVIGTFNRVGQKMFDDDADMLKAGSVNLGGK